MIWTRWFDTKNGEAISRFTVFIFRQKAVWELFGSDQLFLLLLFDDLFLNVRWDLAEAK